MPPPWHKRKVGNPDIDTFRKSPTLEELVYKRHWPVSGGSKWRTDKVTRWTQWRLGVKLRLGGECVVFYAGFFCSKLIASLLVSIRVTLSLQSPVHVCVCMCVCWPIREKKLGNRHSPPLAKLERAVNV